ncbi:MAG: hypothetical protein KAV83_07605 [Desulfobacterales bacterium]|nr:hypothetical protein [Desulfobacterales bacterium]
MLICKAFQSLPIHFEQHLSNKVPEYFQNKNLRLILFGGKGGVGKTTMAAAFWLLGGCSG